MIKLTIEDLQRVLVECAGGDEAAKWTGDVSALNFDELGYDSLALMETATRLQLDYGVQLSEDEIFEVRTPRELLDFVNGRLAEAA
jgi:minimal PKS acyl carrier protein